MELNGVAEKVIISPSEIKSHLEEGRAQDLSKEDFPYHNWEVHIVPMYEDVVELGRLAGLSQKDIDLAQIAVLYHDISLLDGREGHEEKSAQIAEEDLREFGYQENDINRVKIIILGTKGKMEDGVYITEPSDDPLVNIMRDADLANIGKVNFPEQSENLRQELGVTDKSKWREFQIEFLTKHRFHTEVAEQLWGEQKKKNLENL